jgi:sugar lactone lactonase YvrE
MVHALRSQEAMSSRLQQLMVRVVVPVAACLLVFGFGSVMAADNPDVHHIGDATVFATLPFPGHPFGIAVDRDRIYVDTSRGDFFAQQTNSAGERIFVLNAHGNILETITVPTMPDATMGLWGLALDGNRGREHNLFAADMNGRILRVHIGQERPTFEVFSTPPPPFNTGDWHTTMWNDLTFDRAGNLLMTDDKPRIWRITPDGHASVYFTDPRLLGQFGFAGGPLGGRIDPSGQWFYFSITISAEFPGEAVIYRLRLVDRPTPADLELVHRFPAVAEQIPPQASGIAFARSGNLYVGLLGPNQIAVLDPSGNEIRRISSPLFDSPWGLAFLGDSLLVSNADINPVESPEKWIVSKVFVGEPGLPLNRPRTSRHTGVHDDDRVGVGTNMPESAGE